VEEVVKLFSTAFEQNLNGEFIDHPWEVSRMAQRQTRPVQRVVQPFTLLRRRKKISSGALRV
jgi:hypothetical protein